LALPASSESRAVRHVPPSLGGVVLVHAEWWVRHPDQRPKALLFATATGTPRDKDNARERVLMPAVRRAIELLAERQQNPMPERTNKRGEVVPNGQTHSGRRTAITWWAEAGYDEREVMNLGRPRGRRPYPACLPAGAQPPEGPARHCRHGRGPGGREGRSKSPPRRVVSLRSDHRRDAAQEI
jgi:hypothetical protein